MVRQVVFMRAVCSDYPAKLLGLLLAVPAGKTALSLGSELPTFGFRVRRAGLSPVSYPRP